MGRGAVAVYVVQVMAQAMLLSSVALRPSFISGICLAFLRDMDVESLTY